MHTETRPERRFTRSWIAAAALVAACSSNEDPLEEGSCCLAGGPHATLARPPEPALLAPQRLFPPCPSGNEPCGEMQGLADPGFGSDDVTWISERATLARVSEDRTGQPDSGALAVTDEVVMNVDGRGEAAARHCFPVVPGHRYQSLVYLRFPLGDGTATAGVRVTIFARAECQGAITAIATSSLSRPRAWTSVATVVPVPIDSTSVEVRLLVTKPLREGAATALFDDFTLRITEPQR